MDKVDQALAWLSSAEHSDYIGEPVSQLQHALQAAYFAEQSDHSREVILASLFHDIGHFASSTQQNTMAGLGVVNHEWIGAKLAYDLGFSAQVALLIGYHVDAKRYLAGKKTDYFKRLSKASQGTLIFQGGVMSAAEMQNFEKHPDFKAILQVRINDEKAKEVDLAVPGVDYYRSYLYEHFKQTFNQTDDNHLTDYVDPNWAKQFRAFLETAHFPSPFGEKVSRSDG